MRNAGRRAWLVWAVGVLAYAVAVFQRTSLSVAAAPATQRFGIGASVVSSFAVVQLIVYAAMQIPVGMLVDRFGSRLIITLGGLAMAAGQLTLALATEPAAALVARMLVGLGDAMTFISVLRLIPAWFPAQQVPMNTQLTTLIGQLGQVASTIPLVAALSGPGWTATYLGAAAIGVIVALVVLLVVRNRPAGVEQPTTVASWGAAGRDLRESFQQPGTRLGLWSHLTVQFSGMVFALLWGYPFMTVGLGYSPALAGGLLTMMIFTAALIGPALGQLAGRYPARRSNLIIGVVTATVLIWSLVLVWPGQPPLPLMVMLIMVLAAYGPASALGFDFARSFNPAERLGTASGIVNMGGFVASLITIFAMGVILDLRAPDGQFSLADFKVAWCFQYPVWAFGFISLWRTRQLTRRGMRAEGVYIDPLPHAMAERWRRRKQH